MSTPFQQHTYSERSLHLQQVVGARPAATFEESLAQAPLRRVEAKEFLFTEGDASTHLYRIETGALALHKILHDGRRQVVGFAYPGDLIGLGAQSEHLCLSTNVNSVGKKKIWRAEQWQNFCI